MYFQQQFIDKIFLKELKGLYLVLEKTLRQSTRGPGRNKLQQVATNEFMSRGAEQERATECPKIYLKSV